MGLNRNAEDTIVNILVKNVIFSYAWITTPRGSDDLKPGTYGADLIIQDAETEEEITEYLREVLEDAKEAIWKGKIPKDVNLPLRKGKEDVEIEQGLSVLKTNTKIQPKIFIKNPEDGKAYEMDEDEIDEIYSGMIGDAVVKFKSYDYKGQRGITAYLSAVCKTDEGVPLGGTKVSYGELFSDSNAFDAEEEKPAKKGTKKPAKKGAKKPAKKEEEPSIDDLIGGKKSSPATSKSKTRRKVEVEEDDDEELDLDSLLKNKS